MDMPLVCEISLQLLIRENTLHLPKKHLKYEDGSGRQRKWTSSHNGSISSPTTVL